jgi:radical SAM superfamily enzyme YgiQ (UPF0313 family)
MGRRFNPEGLVPLVSDLRKAGIAVSIENIVGMPTETREEMIESLDWTIRNLPGAFITYYRYQPLPGTPMAAMAAKITGVNKDIWLDNFVDRQIDYKGATAFNHPESDMVDAILSIEDAARLIPESIRERVLSGTLPLGQTVMKPIAFINSVISSNINWLPSYLKFYSRQTLEMTTNKLFGHHPEK